VGIWKKQLLVHRDEATERAGLDATGLPRLTLLQSTQLLGWWRQQRGPLLDRKWWRDAMVTILRDVKREDWSLKTPVATNKRVWLALTNVAKRLDKLAPAGQLGADDALTLPGVRRVPGMLADLRSQKVGPKTVRPLPANALAEIARVPKIKIPIRIPKGRKKPGEIDLGPIVDEGKKAIRVPRSLSLGALPLFLILVAIATALKKRK